MVIIPAEKRHIPAMLRLLGQVGALHGQGRPELFRSDALKYDASHSYNRGDDYLGELSDWCERVAHVHIKGTTHAGKRAVADPPAGMDDIKWSSLFSILYARGYDGDLSIEPHSSVWCGELGAAGVLFTRDFIKQYIVR